jgi:hypothetical protein
MFAKKKTAQLDTRPLNPTDQDDRIRAIFGLTSEDPLPESNRDNLQRYQDYLAANLKFPFDAVYWEETGPSQTSWCNLSVLGMADMEGYCLEETGLFFRVRGAGEPTTVVQTKTTRRSGVFGLLSKLLGSSESPDMDTDRVVGVTHVELTAKDANRQLHEDFVYWFWSY